jgi:SAM-dependent methyltransferase
MTPPALPGFPSPPASKVPPEPSASRTFEVQGHPTRLCDDPAVRDEDIRLGRVTIEPVGGLRHTIDLSMNHAGAAVAPSVPGPVYNLRLLAEEILALGFTDRWLFEILGTARRHGLLAQLAPIPLQLSPTATRREAILSSIRGRGIEIGAFQTPLRLGPGAEVIYVDAMPTEMALRYFPEADTRIPMVAPQVIARADRLADFADTSLDFVLASHVLEHVAYPVAALVEWHRVLRPGGTVFLVLPDPRSTLDEHRPRTTLEHVLLDYRQPPGDPARDARDFDHYCTWARAWNQLSDERQITFWAKLLSRIAYPVHFHCWRLEDIAELVEHLGRSGLAPFRVEDSYEREDHYEFTFLLRKE